MGTIRSLDKNFDPCAFQADQMFDFLKRTHKNMTWLCDLVYETCGMFDHHQKQISLDSMIESRSAYEANSAYAVLSPLMPSLRDLSALTKNAWLSFCSSAFLICTEIVHTSADALM